jgi:D-serine deaminase-like pyridoxal phosphate-dependent protein
VKRLALILVLIIAATACWAKSREIRLLTWDPPRYPFIAVADNVQGVVQLRLTVVQGGKVRSAEVISGHPQLRDSAIDAGKKMIFACDQCQADTIIFRNISIRYQIRGKPTEERREKVKRGGDSLIIVTITPLPIQTQTVR